VTIPKAAKQTVKTIPRINTSIIQSTYYLIVSKNLRT